MTGWRDRIDLTTNWAITVVAGMLSISLSTPATHHGVLLFAMVLVLLLLSIEARRYRFFDVYRARVRLLERNYYAQLFAPEPADSSDWARVLSQDLRRPPFLISLRAAMSRRLRRNYFWIFLVLLAAWALKIFLVLAEGEGPQGIEQLLLSVLHIVTLGPVPGWVVLLAVVAFYGWIFHATFRAPVKAGELAHGEVHV